MKAPESKSEDSPDSPLAAYPDASAAKDALVRVVYIESVAFVHRQVPGNLPEPLCLETDAQMAGDLLKLTGAIGRTKATVYRVRRH